MILLTIYDLYKDINFIRKYNTSGNINPFEYDTAREHNLPCGFDYDTAREHNRPCGFDYDTAREHNRPQQGNTIDLVVSIMIQQGNTIDLVVWKLYVSTKHFHHLHDERILSTQRNVYFKHITILTILLNSNSFSI